MRFQSTLLRQQMIEPAIETVLVDLLIAELKLQIAERGAAIPIFGNMQLSRRLAEPRAATSTAAIFDQATRSLPTGSNPSHSSSKSQPTP